MRQFVTRNQTFNVNLMFIGPCIIAIFDEWKTNLMSLAILFHLLCAQHVSDINISIFRSFRLCWWITTSVVLFSVRCVLEVLLRLIFGGVRVAGWSTSVDHGVEKLPGADKSLAQPSKETSYSDQELQHCTKTLATNNRNIFVLFLCHKSWYSVVSLGRCSLFPSRVGLKTYQ